MDTVHLLKLISEDSEITLDALSQALDSDRRAIKKQIEALAGLGVLGVETLANARYRYTLHKIQNASSGALVGDDGHRVGSPLEKVTCDRLTRAGLSHRVQVPYSEIIPGCARKWTCDFLVEGRHVLEIARRSQTVEYTANMQDKQSALAELGRAYLLVEDLGTVDFFLTQAQSAKQFAAESEARAAAYAQRLATDEIPHRLPSTAAEYLAWSKSPYPLERPTCREDYPPGFLVGGVWFDWRTYNFDAAETNKPNPNYNPNNPRRF